MRYAATFNRFTVNSVVLSLMILFSWQTIIQKAHCEAYEGNPKFKERECRDKKSVSYISEHYINFPSGPPVNFVMDLGVRGMGIK
jgi:hypothetical protein